MRINSKKLTGLPVVTKTGAHLGKVSSFDIDTDSGRIESIHVKTRGIVPGLLDEELIVVWSQVIEITETNVIVTDALVPAGVRSIAAHTPKTAPSAGISASVKTS